MNRTDKQENLAVFGGPKTVAMDQGDMFIWPIVTAEHERAVLKALYSNNMSGLDITKEFERQYAEELGRSHALACCNGTAAIASAFYGLGVSVGDEVICPSITFWASVLQVYSMGATPVFADIDPETLCIDPNEIERLISKRTKVIVVVHYAGMPADMDAILPIAKKHGIKVFEDCSHAHASLYKGRQVGTFGDAAGFSLMSAKSFAVGEAGIMFTDDQRIYERALLYGSYARHNEIQLEDLKKYVGLPCGGQKHRLSQTNSAFALVQLKYYKKQFAEIDKAMTYFCDLIDDIPGLKAHRPEKTSGSTKGGWYAALAHYAPEQLNGLSVTRFAQAVIAEGGQCSPGCNKPLHMHPLFTEMDVYGHGKPTRVANLPPGTTIANELGKLVVSESINDRICMLPWFKHYSPEIIEAHAKAYKKTARNCESLLAGNEKSSDVGGYSASFREK